MTDAPIWSRVVCLSVGGVLGVNARYWLALAIDRAAGIRFPWATFVINVTGSFLIGLGAVVLSRYGPHSLARVLVLTGFLGGYTTFSTFTYESLSLFERGDATRAALNLIGSVLLGLAAVWAGAMLGRAFVSEDQAVIALRGGEVRPGADD